MLELTTQKSMNIRLNHLLAVAAAITTAALSLLGVFPQAVAAPPPTHKSPSIMPPNKKVIALFDAAEQGDTVKVRAILDSGVSAKSKYPNGMTPLILAAMMNHPDTVKLLLDRGADVNAALMPGGYIGGSTPLIMAADESMNILAGAKTPPSPPGYEGHEIEFMKQHPDLMQKWEKQMDTWAKGYGVIVKMLIDHGANVNAQTTVGTTAVASAATSGDFETVKLLLDKGARLDLPTHEMNFHGGKPLENTNGYEALAGATSMYQHNPEIIKLLLAHGASPNAKSSNDLTPLGRAAESGDAEVVKMLLDAGASVNAYDAFGHTALMLALRNKHDDVVALLRKAGAKDLPEGPHPEVTLTPILPAAPGAGKGHKVSGKTHGGVVSGKDVYTITPRADKPTGAQKSIR